MNALRLLYRDFRRQAVASLKSRPPAALTKERHEEAEALKAGGEFQNKTIMGFWIYLMTDCVLFASLFATYGVLHNGTNGGVAGADIFDLPSVLLETVLLLTSSFTSGIALLGVRTGNRRQVIDWLIPTFILGACFLGLELHEFTGLVAEGHSWRASAFLSSFFTLVGTHGAHISVGLLWMAVLIITVLKKGLTPLLTKRLTMLILFWHLLDVVWIFIFSIVYLLGVL